MQMCVRMYCFLSALRSQERNLGWLRPCKPDSLAQNGKIKLLRRSGFEPEKRAFDGEVGEVGTNLFDCLVIFRRAITHNTGTCYIPLSRLEFRRPVKAGSGGWKKIATTALDMDSLCPAVVLLVVLFVVEIQTHANTSPEHTDVPLLGWSEWNQLPRVLRGRKYKTGPRANRFLLRKLEGGQGEGWRRVQSVGLLRSERLDKFEGLLNGAFSHYVRFVFSRKMDSRRHTSGSRPSALRTPQPPAHRLQINAVATSGATSPQVIFDWAPFCSGPLSVGEMMAIVMAEGSAEEQGEGINRRPTIITAFGLHDAAY